jgi:hypothetical protein
MQNDTKPENMRALVEAAREFGVYDAPDALDDLRVVPGGAVPAHTFPSGSARAPGVCVPWAEHARSDLAGPVQGSAELAERVWTAADAGGAMFIWQMLLSF